MNFELYFIYSATALPGHLQKHVCSHLFAVEKRPGCDPAQSTGLPALDMYAKKYNTNIMTQFHIMYMVLP